MRYIYDNNKGIRREINASMKDPPPHAVEFNDDGSWKLASESDGDSWRDGVWLRVYGEGVTINQQKVTGQFGFASRTLPRNIPGEECNSRGQVIVKSKAHARELCQKTGYTQFD